MSTAGEEAPAAHPAPWGSGNELVVDVAFMGGGLTGLAAAAALHVANPKLRISVR